MKENQEYPLYEDEIDLRALLETLWRGRKFIFVFTLLTTLLTLGISLFLPRQYTASVFILVNSPLIDLSKSTLGGTDLAFSSPIPDLKSLVEMAQSPGVLGKVFDSQSATGTAQEERVFGEFSGGLVAEALGKDQIQLKVTDTDPERAASIANAWARSLTQLINASYSSASLAQMLAPQVQKTYESYQQAQAKLEQALKESQLDALQARLKSKQDELASVLASLTRTQRVLDDLATLEKQLSGQSPEATLPLNYGLALITLQQRALTVTSESFTAQIDSASLQQRVLALNNESFTVQVDSASFANFTVAQALETIAAMRTALQGQLQSLQEQQRRIEQEIPQLQSELAKASAELDEFFIQRDQAASLYKALLSRQQLVQTLQSSIQVARVSVPAAPPSTPSSPRIGMNVLLAATVGLLLSVAWVLIENWWRNDVTGKQ
jgi:succinoglycan biosynthesis transport protein ExoP